MVKNKWIKEKVITIIWAGLALAVLVPITQYLRGSFPIFTVIWLAVPLFIVLRTSDAARVGVRSIPWRRLLVVTAINLALLQLVSLAVEPWSHAYQGLVRRAIAASPPDTTFAWLVRFNGIPAWAGMFLFSGLVTIFGEELFFRGWLFQYLQTRIDKTLAIVIQAALFSLPQALAAFLLTPSQGIVYAVVYSFLGVGIIGGWAACRTQSIWPSLLSATIWNLVMVAWVR